jgi:flagellar biosynthetic protein FlhB
LSGTTQEKTELPTGKRLGEARKRGQVPKSRDLTAVGVLTAGAISVYLSRGLIYQNFRHVMEYTWSAESFLDPGRLTSSGFFTHLVASIMMMIGPPVFCMLVTAVFLNVVQLKGFMISFEALRVSFSNLNPLSGLKRIFSLRSLTELIKSIFKMGTVAYAVYMVLWPERVALLELVWKDVPGVLGFIGATAMNLVFRVAGVMLALSLLDYMYQKWQTRKDLMMTRQEIKEEMKQSEGNPQIKSRIRSIQRNLARQRMFSKIPKASVIITNPTHFAVALQYEAGMQAPTVVAKGMDFLALKIIELGRKHGVSVVQNPPLARALYKQVKLEESIPVELYKAVAKILAFIYQQKQAMRRTYNG